MDSSVAADIAAVKPKLRTDHYVWGVYIALILISVVELFSASSQEVQIDDIYGPIIRHARFLGIGCVIMWAIQRIHFKYIYYFIPFFVIGSLVMMMAVLTVGININGARRGLMVLGQLLLPAEFLKLAVALGIAWILSRSQLKGQHDVSTAGVVACAVLVLISSAMLFSHGLTNTLLLMSISICMMLIGGVGLKKLLVVVGIYLVLGAGGMAFKHFTSRSSGPTPEEVELAQINQEEVRAKGTNRSSTWFARMSRHFRLNKSEDPITDANKQEQLSYIAQARGGITGVGIGRSRENARLPLAFSDYIYAIIIEEMGLFAGIFVLACYLWLLGRAGRLSMVFKSTLPCLLVIGCALVVCLQALFHIGIVVGVFPVSGQPLPLISKGGTSILATSIALGIILSASRWAARKDDDEAIRKELETLPENITGENPSQL